MTDNTKPTANETTNETANSHVPPDISPDCPPDVPVPISLATIKQAMRPIMVAMLRELSGHDQPDHGRAFVEALYGILQVNFAPAEFSDFFSELRALLPLDKFGSDGAIIKAALGLAAEYLADDRSTAHAISKRLKSFHGTIVNRQASLSTDEGT